MKIASSIETGIIPITGLSAKHDIHQEIMARQIIAVTAVKTSTAVTAILIARAAVAIARLQSHSKYVYKQFFL